MNLKDKLKNSKDKKTSATIKKLKNRIKNLELNIKNLELKCNESESVLRTELRETYSLVENKLDKLLEKKKKDDNRLA